MKIAPSPCLIESSRYAVAPRQFSPWRISRPLTSGTSARAASPTNTSGRARTGLMPLRHDMVIHAPTGAILLQFAEVGLRGRDTRVADLLQPDWTKH